MKHCPECNRNYADAELSYCLDDGATLLFGPANKEPETAILERNARPGEEPTRFEHDDRRSRDRADETSTSQPSVGRSRSKGWLFVVLGVAVLSIGGYLAYRYATSGNDPSIQSIAVLPFENASGNPENEFLCDGITESLINSLSQLKDIKVIARSSVFRYKGKEIDPQTIASELHVQALMMGRVIEREGTLDIRVELTDPVSKTQLWGEHYTRKISDFLSLQDDVAKEISQRLRLQLTSAERQRLAKRPTENIQAFQYYMQGRTYFQRSTREDLLTAIRFYEKALEEDRNYALAYAGIAEVNSVLGARGYLAPKEGRLAAQETARKALSLDENLAEAHAALGQAYILFAPHDFSQGDEQLRRAIELSPSLASAHQYLGLSLARQGRLDESVQEVLKARELDPLSSIIAHLAAFPFYLKRDHGRALDMLRRANELGPALSTSWEIGVYIQNRSFDEAEDELEKARRERDDDPILIYDAGMIYAAQGKRTEALQVIKRLEGMSGPNLNHATFIAKIYAAMNEKDLTFSWLERGLATGAIGPFYKDEPIWDSLRSDPRFADLLRRMNVPQ